MLVSTREFVSLRDADYRALTDPSFDRLHFKGHPRSGIEAC